MATEQYIQPQEINWTLARGDTWPLAWEFGTEEFAVFTPDNLTGATVRLQLRTADGLLLETLTPTITPLAGLVDATRPASETNVAWSIAYYELEITYATGERRTEVTGSIRVVGGMVAS